MQLQYTTVPPELSKKAQDDTPFFSALPRHVYTLREKGILKSRDVEVLGLLLDYKTAGKTVVCPSHDELKKRLGCSHDTIQRSLARLKQSGLVLAERLRDLRGRWGKWVYDLAAVFTHLPVQSALRTGQYGEQDEPKKRPSTHKRRVSEIDSCFVKADKAARANTQAELSPEAAAAAVDLASQGVDRKAAERLARKHGAEQCRAALALAKQSKGRIQSPGWLVQAVEKGWAGAAGAVPRPPCASPAVVPGYFGGAGQAGGALPPACQPYRPAWGNGAETKTGVSGGERQPFQEARAWLRQKGGRQ